MTTIQLLKEGVPVDAEYVPDASDVTARAESAESGRRSLQTLAAELDGAFPERREVIDSLITALVARQHVLLLGPPGVAKSAVARGVCDAIGGSYFEHLMTQFTDPSEVFGPFSMKGLQNDQYLRVTQGKLPDADVAFLDEVFKANSAILNTLLTIVNERRFHNGGVPQPVPLKMMVTASNEIPDEGSDLDAFHDRILVRKMVHRIAEDAAFVDVMWNARPRIATVVEQDEVDALSEHALTLQATPEAKQAIAEIRRDAIKKGLKISDRRWVQAASFLRARAALDGTAKVTTASLMPLVDIMWTTSDQIPTCREIVEARAATWMRQVQAIRKCIDEQTSALGAARGLTQQTQKFAAVGAVLDTLDSIARDIAALMADGDAMAEAAKLGALERGVREAGLAMLRGRS